MIPCSLTMQLSRTVKFSRKDRKKYFVKLTEEKENQKQVQSRYPMCQNFHGLEACYSYKKMEVGDGSFSWRKIFVLVAMNQQGKTLLEKTARGEEFTVKARKITQQDCMDTIQKAKNQRQ